MPFKLFVLLCSILSACSGYHLIVDIHPHSPTAWQGYLLKCTLTLGGIAVGAATGSFFAHHIHRLATSKACKMGAVCILLFSASAPIIWLYQDGQEYTRSASGLKAALVINLASLAMASLLLRKNGKDLARFVVLLFLWQCYSVTWFVGTTWQYLDFWD